MEGFVHSVCHTPLAHSPTRPHHSTSLPFALFPFPKLKGFLESIEELLELKEHAAQLKETVNEVQEEIKRNGKPLVDAAVAVSAARTIQHNVIKSISALMTCLPGER